MEINATRDDRGWTLIGMMIILLSISVLAMALRNTFTTDSNTLSGLNPVVSVDRNIQSALDNICFQVKRAVNMQRGIDNCCRIGYAFGKDTLAINSGDIEFIFFVDGDKNLIRQYENSAIILVSGIENFQLRKIDNENLMISIIPVPSSLFEKSPVPDESRSFAAVVKLRPSDEAVNAGI